MPRLYAIFLRTAAFFGMPSPADAAGTSFCKLIDVEIPNRVFWPRSSAYNVAQSQYYSGQEQDLNPACIFRPESASEVSRFMTLVATEDAAESKRSMHFAIRGGGHSVFPGAANIDGGVTVDMRAMNSVALSDDNKVAFVGGGGIWSEIYPQLERHDLTVAGGRVAGVGVGGFLTGGGVSYLSRKYGWACDSVLGYEVVLASGEIVHATADSHRDLWLALRGGSNNFGIVTRFDLVTYPKVDMWGGTLMFEYLDSVLDAQAQAFSDFMDPKNFDDAASMFVALFYLHGAWFAANVLFYVEPVSNPPVFQPFTSIPSPLSSTLRLTKVSDLATEQPSTRPPEANRAVDIVYSFSNPSAAVYSELFRAFEDGAKAMAEVDKLDLSLLIQPHAVSNGTNSLGLPPGGHDLVLSVVTAAYANRADDEKVQKGVEAIVGQHVSILQRAGRHVPFQYLNYADKASQDPIENYGADLKAQLQSASRKYDPRGVFQRRVPGGFKLFDPTEEGSEGRRDEL